MAVLSNIKNKIATGLMSAADKAENIVAKASELSSEQLRNVEARRQQFLNEKPETDPEGIKRLLGSYAIEAFEAYLSQLSQLYEPMPLEADNDERNLINRIRYFEITKWVSDSSEDSLEKLINVYQVISHDDCNMALVYNRKKKGCRIFLAVVSTAPEDKPQNANILEEKITSAIKGNFPGVEIKQREEKNKQKDNYGFGVLPCMNNLEGYSVASVSNIATEKSDDFLNQNMEKLLDGICPEKDDEEYSIVLLATPVTDQIERKTALSELYSKLAPYVSWQTNYTCSETDTEGSSASFALGSSASFGLGERLKQEKDSASSVGGTGIGVNFGVNFARSSDVSVTLGKSEGLTQTFVNHGIKYALDTIEKQIKRLDESSALGMWEFASYFISRTPKIANNTAHMYLALTQGDESYLSQSAVNLWLPPANKYILEFIKRLQHPQFQLRDIEGDNWLMYPPHVSATVSLTGRELARSLNFPKKSVSGIPVIECTAFGREVHKYEIESNNGDTINFGHVYHMHHDEVEEVELDVDSLASHTFITGSTGTGKSNAVYQLIDKVKSKNIHFMVIEPAKGEYKDYLGEDTNVFGTNPDETQLLYVNPFSFPDGVHVLEHIDRLVEILNACWPMYAAMPAVLKDSIERVYMNRGWNLQKSKCGIKGNGRFPTFADILLTLPEVMEESSYSADTKSDYSGALITRIKSLTTGLNGQLFCSGVEIDEKFLFEENTIIDLSRIGAMETRSLFMGILVMKLQEYHMSRKKNTDEKLKHLTILEEAHNLLRKTSVTQAQEGANLQGKSVEMITNSIAEMRTYGEGFVIVDQAPGLLDEAVIRNTNTKIILRLPDADDRKVVGKSVALNDNQIEEVAKLPKGVAVVYQNNWIESVLCHFDKFKDKRSYKKKMYRITSPQDIFYTHIFKNDKFKSLKKEDVDSVLAWIESSKYAWKTKRIMSKAVEGNALSAQEEQLIAYNVFEGKTVARLLFAATKEQEGVDKADYFIQVKTGIEDRQIVEVIRQMIIRVIISENRESDLAGRYVEYSGKIW